MRKTICGFLGIWAVFSVLFTLLFSNSVFAETNVNVNINLGPPPIKVVAPAEVVLIPRLGVHFVPDLEFTVFFYDGYWWSPRGAVWYRATAYNGSWVIINRPYVPTVLFKVPGNYRVIYAKERHIPYGQWKKTGPAGKGPASWKGWGKGKGKR